MAFLSGGNWQLVGEFEEIESGKNNARPQLARAMEACRLKGATLVMRSWIRCRETRPSSSVWKRRQSSSLRRTCQPAHGAV